MTKQRLKIKEFLDILTINVPLSDYQTTSKARDLGLVISSISPENFINDDTKNWIINSEYNFLDNLVKIKDESKDIIIQIKNNPSNNFISALRECSTRGVITLIDEKVVIDIKKIKIVCLVSSEILDQVTYPYFESLFGPILRLNE